MFMNNDILREILKYVSSSVDHKKINDLLTCTHNMKRKVNCVAQVLEKKLSVRPSLEDLRERRIILLEEDRPKTKEIQERVDKVLQSGGSLRLGRLCVAPSISNIVKKMDFEYKKILIIHKLGIKRIK